MQFVLYDEIGRRQGCRQRRTAPQISGTVKPFGIGALDTTEKRRDRAFPGHCRKLVDRRDQKGGQTAIDRLVNRQHRQAWSTRELAATTRTYQEQVRRTLRIR